MLHDRIAGAGDPKGTSCTRHARALLVAWPMGDRLVGRRARAGVRARMGSSAAPACLRLLGSQATPRERR